MHSPGIMMELSLSLKCSLCVPDDATNIKYGIVNFNENVFQSLCSARSRPPAHASGLPRFRVLVVSPGSSLRWRQARVEPPPPGVSCVGSCEASTYTTPRQPRFRLAHRESACCSTKGKRWRKCAVSGRSAALHARPVGISIVLEINASDCDSLNEGLRIGAQGPTCKHSPRKRVGSAELAPTLVDITLDSRCDGGS